MTTLSRKLNFSLLASAIPVSLGYIYFAITVCHAPVWVAVLTGIIAACVIFMIDRAIVTISTCKPVSLSNKKTFKVALKMALGLVMLLLFVYSIVIIEKSSILDRVVDNQQLYWGLLAIGYSIQHMQRIFNKKSK